MTGEAPGPEQPRSGPGSAWPSPRTGASSPSRVDGRPSGRCHKVRRVAVAAPVHGLSLPGAVVRVVRGMVRVKSAPYGTVGRQRGCALKAHPTRRGCSDRWTGRGRARSLRAFPRSLIHGPRPAYQVASHRKYQDRDFAAYRMGQRQPWSTHCAGKPSPPSRIAQGLHHERQSGHRKTTTHARYHAQGRLNCNSARRQPAGRRWSPRGCQRSRLPPRSWRPPCRRRWRFGPSLRNRVGDIPRDHRQQ